MQNSHPDDLIARLLEADLAIARQLARNQAVRWRLSTWWPTSIALRRAERDLLRSRLDAHRHAAARASGDSDERTYLERALREAHHEIAALRASASWRVTAPLRALYDLLRPRVQ